LINPGVVPPVPFNTRWSPYQILTCSSDSHTCSSGERGDTTHLPLSFREDTQHIFPCRSTKGVPTRNLCDKSLSAVDVLGPRPPQTTQIHTRCSLTLNASAALQSQLVTTRSSARPEAVIYKLPRSTMLKTASSGADQ
jgi:hypothetical protein